MERNYVTVTLCIELSKCQGIKHFSSFLPRDRGIYAVVVCTTVCLKLALLTDVKNHC